jgi:predicted amino acid dehydrogenase
VALQEACGLPVTTGNAATSWAAARLGKEVLLERKLGRVAVVGGAGTVGKAVAGLLKEEGVEVVLDPEKIGEFEVILGCHTTGGQLAPEAVKRGAVLIDVALPRTLKKGPAPHVEQLKGESLILPEGWKRDGWGVLLHLVAGYGLNHVYACVIEPLVAVAVGRTVPWAQGKRLTVQTVREFGREAEKLGFVPGRVRLAPFRGAG